jgi:formylglycine-generating enzyme required for sulfatase activity/predicted Ser/Thr protein kinase
MLNNRYRIVKLLGQGGFGAVYKAWDVNLDTPRAVKENLETSPEAQRQFKREAQILGKLTHPNLPKVIDHFTVPGEGQYLVMEYIEGDDLDSLLSKSGGAFPVQKVLEWIDQICNALHYLHSQQPPVIHRDIKPANIKITPQGKAMLVDFGIAKVIDPTTAATTGARAVIPGYSSSEQCIKDATDTRTDIYAMGATLYHLLSGKAPVESIEHTTGTSLPAPRNLNAPISARVESAILKAMQPTHSECFASIADLQQALAAPSTAPVATPPSNRLFAGRFTLPGKLPWWLIATGIGLLVVGALLMGVLFRALGIWREGFAIITDPAETQAYFNELASNPVPATATSPPSTAPLSRTDLLTSTGIRTPTASLSPTDLLTPSDTRTPTASLTPTTPPPSITDRKGVVMNLVPAGSFMMGSESGDPDEKPVHEVYLDAFYIDIYEVTNEMYANCVAARVCTNPSETKSWTRDSYYGNPQFVQFPVIFVSWNDAVKFCEWRGVRLPTEAEWEKAAQGGLEGKKYPWGDQDPVCTKGAVNGAQSGSCSPRDTVQVGSFTANGYGLYDMAGNVWEWVQDRISSYSSQSSWINPTTSSLWQYKVMRGGSWYDFHKYLRSAMRFSSHLDYHYYHIGFRCGMSAPGNEMPGY